MGLYWPALTILECGRLTPAGGISLPVASATGQSKQMIYVSPAGLNTNQLESGG